MATLFVARTSDGFVISCSASQVDRDVVKQTRTLFQNHNLLLKQVSLECGDKVYHYQYGKLISVMLVAPPSYSTMEAFSRIGQIHEDYLMMFPAAKIQSTSCVLVSGKEELKMSLEASFDETKALTMGEMPPREHISIVMEKIKGSPFGFSSRVLKKKKHVVLDWKEIGLLVPLTLIAFIKTLVAFRVGGTLLITSNILSTAVAFYLVFICVHDLLTTSRLILCSFVLLLLTYATTFQSLPSIVFNGIFALLTLANVAHWYLKPDVKHEKV